MYVFTTPKRRAHRDAVAATWGKKAASIADVSVNFAFGRRSGYDPSLVSAKEDECERRRQARAQTWRRFKAWGARRSTTTPARCTEKAEERGRENDRRGVS